MANGEIYEQNLSNASGIASGDYLRTVNSSNESEKINYTLLAKAIIEQYAGSTIGGTAQTVKSAIDRFNYIDAGNNPDFNTLTENGFYYIGQISSTAQNAPQNVYGYLDMIVVKVKTSNLVQVLFGGRQEKGRCIWTRYYNSGTWSEWLTVSAPDVGVEIPSNSNLDNYTNGGSFYVSNATTASSITNTPVTSAGYRLDVVRTVSVDRIYQFAYLTTTTPTIYIRTYTSSGWGAWYRFVQSTEIEDRLKSLRYLDSSYGTSGISGTTKTFTLESANTYLLVLGNVNSSTANSSTVYLITAHSGSSNLTLLGGSETNNATVSVSSLTLTITYNKNYVLTRLIKV